MSARSGVIDYTEFIAATIERNAYIKEDACWAASALAGFRSGVGVGGGGVTIGVLTGSSPFGPLSAVGQF